MASDASQRTGPRAAGADAGPASRPHDEWLLDQAIMETFPASDPVAAFDEHDAAAARAGRARGSTRPYPVRGLAWIAAGALVCGVALLARGARQRAR